MTSFDPNAAAPKDSGVFGLSNTPDNAHVILVPVPFEATCSYGGGTSNGPKAILAASRQVDLYDQETGKPYARGLAMLPIPQQVLTWNETAKKAAAPVVAAGGVAGGDAALQAAAAEVNTVCARMNTWVQQTVAQQLSAGKVVGTVGGDHSISFGAIAAHHARYPEMGILHVDAHADLRDAYEGFTWSHASIMHNVMTRLDVKRLVQVGIRDFCEQEAEMVAASKGRIKLFHDADVAWNLAEGTAWTTLCQRMVEVLPREVYISFDIDGLEPGCCPHTGTPAPGGLSFHQAITLFKTVVRTGRRIVGFDLTEVAPGPDDEWDANVGARLLYKLIGWTLKSQH
jgi:agmatinase